MESRQYTIGFSNLSEQHGFAVTVRESIEAAAAQHANIDLIVRDNAMDNQRAMANVQDFIKAAVDLAIIYHIDERIGANLGSDLLRSGIPVIAVDIPNPWSIYFGVNNQQSGTLVGEALGRWIQTHWDGEAERVIVLAEHRVLDLVRQRIEYALNALQAAITIDENRVLYINCGNEREPTIQEVLPVLERWDDVHRIAVIGFNDASAMGALDAARRLGREQDVAVAGQGANLAFHELENPNSHFVASTDFFPEQYGPRLFDLALRIFNGERVPRQNFMEHVCLTKEVVKR